MKFVGMLLRWRIIMMLKKIWKHAMLLQLKNWRRKHIRLLLPLRNPPFFAPGLNFTHGRLLLKLRLLHESSSSYEMDGETLEGSVSLAAPECEVTNQNCEMYDHKHEGSVPVDIPECETAKDVVVDSINSKKKKKDKVVQTSNVAPVGMAEDEMHWATRLLGKRKTSGTVAEQPNMEDHLIKADEEYELRGAGKFVSQPAFFQKPNRQALKIAAKFHEQRKLVEKEWEEETVSRLRVEDQLLNTQNMVSRLEETLANVMQNKARQNKNGEYVDEVTREQTEVIDELKKQVNNGSLVCDGNIEVPIMAVRTPLRGTGKFETQAAFFQKPKCQAVKVGKGSCISVHHAPH